MQTIDWLDQRNELLMQLLWTVTTYVSDPAHGHDVSYQDMAHQLLKTTDALLVLDEQYLTELGRGDNGVSSAPLRRRVVDW